MASNFDKQKSIETYTKYLSNVEIGTVEKKYFSMELETMCSILSEYIEENRPINKHHLIGAMVYIEYLKRIVDKLDDRETTT